MHDYVTKEGDKECKELCISIKHFFSAFFRFSNIAVNDTVRELFPRFFDNPMSADHVVGGSDFLRCSLRRIYESF
jgi:hypothetical protein